jgi:hypothetical protein
MRRLNLKPAWVRVLPLNPIPTIVQQASPGVQLRLLPLLTDGKDTDSQVLAKQLRKGASSGSEVARIQRRQADNGTWPVDSAGQPEGVVKQLVQLSLLENLHALFVLGGDRSWLVVKKGLAALLEYQHEDGRFPLLYHHHACIGRLLIDLGLGRNPAVHRAVHWILDRQRPDGGWLHPQMAGQGKQPQSCLWTTAEVLAFIGRYRTFRVKEHLDKAGEFLLSHALEPNATTLLPEATSWDILEVGSRGMHLFHGGTLKVLDGLTLAGFNPSHTTFKKLYTWLLSQQLDNGYFPRIVGQDAEGDPLVTIRALEVIQRIETSRPE